MSISHPTTGKILVPTFDKLESAIDGLVAFGAPDEISTEERTAAVEVWSYLTIKFHSLYSYALVGGAGLDNQQCLDRITIIVSRLRQWCKQHASRFPFLDQKVFDYDSQLQIFRTGGRLALAADTDRFVDQLDNDPPN